MGVRSFLTSFFAVASRRPERPRAPAAPAGPGVMTAAETHRFAELLTRHFAAQGRVFELDADGARLDGKAAPAALALAELSEQCLQAQPRDWDACLQRHFAARAPAEERLAGARWLDFSTASQFLVAVPVAPEVLSHGPSDRRPGRVYRTDLAGRPTVLFFDLDGERLPVERRHFAAWGRRPSELFRAALRNVRTRAEFVEAPIDLGDGYQGAAIAARNGYAAAAVYFLGAFRSVRGALGSLLALDPAGRLIAAPVDAPGALPGLATRLRRAVAAASGGNLTAGDLYFWDGSRFYRQEGKIAGRPDPAGGKAAMRPAGGSRRLVTGTN